MKVQIPLGIVLREGVSFENYVAGENIEAVQHLKKSLSILATDGLATQQAIYLWGSQGCGKTHLLQAACQQMALSECNSVYLPMSLLEGVEPSMFESMDELSLVCIDDVHLIAGQRIWEEALFHLYNRMRDAGGLMLISGDASPAALDLTLADLASRLSWGWVFQLAELDDEAKRQVLQCWAQARGLEMPDEVARYMLNRFQRNLDVLLELLQRLDYASLVEQRRLTIPFVRACLLSEK